MYYNSNLEVTKHVLNVITALPPANNILAHENHLLSPCIDTDKNDRYIQIHSWQNWIQIENCECLKSGVGEGCSICFILSL